MHLKEIGALLPTVNKVAVRDDGDLTREQLKLIRCIKFLLMFLLEFTVLGELLASLPVDVRLGKFIIFSHLFDVLDEAVIIAAGLSNKSIFTTPIDKKLE